MDISDAQSLEKDFTFAFLHVLDNTCSEFGNVFVLNAT